MPDAEPDAPIEPAVAASPANDVPLRRNTGFQLLWVGSSFSFLAKEITDLVYPLLILALTGSPAWAGTFAAVQTFTTMALGLPAGELTDRYNRRRILLGVEAARASVTGTVAVAVMLDALTLPHILVAGVLVGAAQPLGGSARMLLVRSLVPPRQLTAALTQEEVRSYGSSLAGPPLGGLLYGIASAVPVVGAAVAYATSFVCAWFVRPPVEPLRSRATEGGPVRRMFAGLTTIWQADALRRTLLLTTAMNVISAPLLLIVIVRLVQEGAPPGVIGLTSAGLAVGGLAGAALVGPLHRRLRPGTLMLAQGASLAVVVALMALPWGPWWLFGLLLASVLGVPTMRVLVDVVIFRQTPAERRGRTISAAMTVYGLGASAGLFVGGQLLEHMSARSTALVLSAATAIVVLAAASNGPLRRTPWPQEVEPEDA